MKGGSARSTEDATPTRARSCEIWGVLNVTPDSFSDGGAHLDLDQALQGARRMVNEGADVLDVGGESSRPAGGVYGAGATDVPADLEQQRVVPVIERVVGELGARVSVDTVKAEVARAALRAGARIVNDVSCARSEALLGAVGEADAELVLMHNRGRGEVKGRNIAYDDVVGEVADELGSAIERAVALGVSRERIWVDPGIGFAKTSAQSATLLRRTDALVAMGHRVLVGPSRKSFIATLAPWPDGRRPGPDERLGGTAAAVIAGVLGGADAVRVHDVAVMRQAVRVTEGIATAGGEQGADREGRSR